MNIVDLNYQEIVNKPDDLSGGLDWAASFTSFQQRLALIQTKATSGPTGSTATTLGGLFQISTFGLGMVALGA